MPRVIVGGKVVYLGYLDQSARCLIEEVLRLTGQGFTWDVASDSLIVEPTGAARDPVPAPKPKSTPTEALDLSQLLTGLVKGTVTPAAASAVIGRPISVGYGKVALQIRKEGTPPAQTQPDGAVKPPEFDDPRDAMPPRPDTGRSKHRKGQATVDDGEPWPVTIKPIGSPLGRPSTPTNPRTQRRPHT